MEPVGNLKQVIADYFKENPGCIVRKYEHNPAEAEKYKLAELEQYCANPDVWEEFEECYEECHGEVDRMFLLKDFSVLEKHGYYDEDAVQVIITHKQGNSEIITWFEVECH